MQMLAAQVEEPVLEPDFLRIIVLAKHWHRQLNGRAEHLDAADEDFDSAGGQFQVLRPGGTFAHLALDPHHPFRAQLFNLLERRRIRIGDALGHAVMVAQVDEQKPAMVADAVAPTGQPHGLTDIALPQGVAMMGTVAMHYSMPGFMEEIGADWAERTCRRSFVKLTPGAALRSRTPTPAHPDKRFGLRYQSHPMQPITTTGELEDTCARLAQHPFVTVDTEFLRESTYYPKLCVAQMASTEEAVVVDALAPEIDLAPFFTLMANERVVKVFHAARQDIEICWHEAGTIPCPLVDTQVAAMVLGYGDSISYDQLVHRITGDTLDKSHRFTDWTRRPLTPAQLTYAVSDVTHLRDVYAKLAADLESRGRTEWMREEMKILSSPDTYRMEPEHAWERLKNSRAQAQGACRPDGGSRLARARSPNPRRPPRARPQG